MSTSDDKPLPTWLTVEQMTPAAFAEMVEYIKPKPWPWKEWVLAEMVDQLDALEGTTPTEPYDDEG